MADRAYLERMSREFTDATPWICTGLLTAIVAVWVHLIGRMVS